MNKLEHPRTTQIKRQQKEEANKARIDTLKWLASTFPEAFNTERRVRPLKIGIMQDILDYIEKHRPENISKTKIRQVVVMFTRRMEYLVCLKCRNHRVDLDGQFAGQVTEEEAEKAAAKIKQRMEQSLTTTAHTAKKTSKKTTYHREAQAENSHFNPTDAYQARNQSHSQYLAEPETTPANPTATQVTIKRKISRRIDPDAVARLKAKLGISKETA